MHTGFGFVRDWEPCALERNQTAFANLVAQYESSATANIPGSPGVGLIPRKDSEPGMNERFLRTVLSLVV